jgi:putative peptide zinc metalloprotease protein
MVRFFAQGIGLWGTVIVIVAGALLLAPNFLPILFNRLNFEILGSSVVGFFFYFLLLFPILVVHEIAHGATLAYYGSLWDVMPGEVGTGLYYFGPMFYVDTSDSWVLPRKMRVMVSLAGPLSTLLIGSLFVFADLVWPSQILKMASFFCFYWMLWNFLPLIETDGYYAIMDYVDIPNLKKEAFERLKSKIFRRKEPEQEKFGPRKTTFLTWFALLSVAFVAVLAYQTYIIFQYMATDTFLAVARISQMKSTNIAVDLATIAYFALMAVGFITMPFSLLRRTRKEASDV